MLPDLPTVGEFVPGYEASGWYGIGAPRNTQAEIIDILNKEINAALADPNMKARIADLGGTVLTGSPTDFGKRSPHTRVGTRRRLEGLVAPPSASPSSPPMDAVCRP